ncbi:MAG TPA: TonB-dependent receptor, partial [Gammaproteobacteria bacterium]
IHHINPKHTIRVGVSKATRTPTLFEEAGQIVYSQDLTINGGPLPSSHLLEQAGINPIMFTSMLTPGNLDSEEITSYEIGYIANLIEDKLLLDIKVFKDQTHKLITFDDTQTVFEYTGSTTDLNTNETIDLIVNGLESEVYGTEIALDYRVSNSLRLYGFFAHLNIDSQHYINSSDDKWTVRLNNSVPEDSGGLMIIKKWPGNIDTSLAYYNVGDMAWQDRTNDDSAQPYQKVDARIAKTWQSGKEVIKLAMIGQNLKEDVVDYNNKTTTDPNTGEVRAGSILDRRVYFELSFSFN